MERLPNPQPKKKKKLMADAKTTGKQRHAAGTKPQTPTTTTTTPPPTTTTTSSKLASDNENHAKDKDIYIDIEPVEKAVNLDDIALPDQVEQQPVDTDAQNMEPVTNVDEETKDLLGPESDESQTTSDQLPDTVTILKSPNGSEVYLVGTAHFSHKSADEVKRVIQMVQPSAVILELCKERAFMLTLDEQSLLEQNRKLSFDNIRNAIAQKGLAQGLIYIMFIKMSASMTEKLGMAPGSEFRVGAKTAQEIPNCSVILGDRSLKVTVARAVASVSTWQKIKLIYQVLVNDVSITQEDVEKCKNKDILEQLLEELGGEFPGFKKVLLDERNIYLAHSIWQWAQRSDTKIVAIVGMGHVKGIVDNWGTTTNEEVMEISELPPKVAPSKTRRFVKICVYIGIAYFGFKTLAPTSWQDAVHEKIVARLAEIKLR